LLSALSLHRPTDEDLTIGLYSPQSTIIDIFCLRHEIGADIANDALRRWRDRSPGAAVTRTGRQPR
jgi:hypothetical protein